MRIFRCLFFLLLCMLITLNTQGQQWEAAPLGAGEGGQRIMTLAVDQTDGDYIIFGTDVGGIFHSADGKDYYRHTNVGFEGQGSGSVTIDPNNPKVVYVSAMGNKAGEAHNSNGVYRSTDQGLTWQWVLKKQDFKNNRDRRDHLVVDPTSLDPELGHSSRVYYSSLPGAFFRSTDGGETWSEHETFTGKYWLAVSPENGAVFAGNNSGLYRSTDYGDTFEKISDDQVTGIDAAGGTVVYCTKDNKIMLSLNAGESFTETTARGIPNDAESFLTTIKLSPADPQRMLVSSRNGNDTARLISHDSGATWKASNDRDGYPLVCGVKKAGKYLDFTWHPTDPNVCWSYNRAYMVKSTDGGRSFKYANEGYTGIYMGQKNSFHFNATNPDYIAFPSLDWDGAVTFDAGETWKNTGIKKGPWGWTFGVYAVRPGVWFGGESKTHSPRNIILKITRDNGKTFTSKKLDYARAKDTVFSSYHDPANPRTWFYLYWRSEDEGKTWKEMKDIRGVVTHDPTTNALYGIGEKKDDGVMRSTDGGKTWESVWNPAIRIRDIAVAPGGKMIYAVASEGFKQFDTETGETTNLLPRLLKDQKGTNKRLWSVAIDPVDPRVAYVVRGAHRYQPDNSVQRTIDGGKTWHSLTVSDRWDNHHHAMDGGGSCIEGLWVRVHPETRYAYVGTNDFGYWKIGPPSDSEEPAIE